MRAETKIQPNNCNPAKTKRPPFNDITNMFNSRMDSEVHAELVPPSRASRELAMGRENSSETFGGAAACYNLPGTSMQHQRPVQLSLPPSLPSSTVSHCRSESLGHKSSRRLNSSDARTQRLHVPDLDVGSSVNRLPSRDHPAAETPFLPVAVGTTWSRATLNVSAVSENSQTSTRPVSHSPLALCSRGFPRGRTEERGGKATKKIKILLYSAPHLSTPCCLAEPVATYSLNELPADWYRLYEQAKKVIEHIKRNVPKFVMYEGAFVCTLMANEPRADVEIRASSRIDNLSYLWNAPRVSKKTMFCTARGVPVDAEDWSLLSNNEKECLAALLDFLRIVEVLEGIPRGKAETLSTTSAELPPKCLTTRDATLLAQSAATPCHGGDTISPKASLPKSVAPTSSAVLLADRFKSPRASSTAVSDAPPSRASPLSSANCAPSSESLHGLSRPRLQTRFIPGVGWCVRSGGTHYRIMFQDGVALEVDVDEERVELVEHDGSVTRYTVRDCSASRKVGDRMKVFQKFIPLFD
ncbi:hypothetical protein EDB85DRAFT_2139439 [Lactarius pseudohatsudake]|nr:hypothetical protein EDB85DRAFT_2139439 [Lactarius pseudohatsudake]